MFILATGIGATGVGIFAAGAAVVLAISLIVSGIATIYGDSDLCKVSASTGAGIFVAAIAGVASALGLAYFGVSLTSGAFAVAALLEWMLGYKVKCKHGSLDEE